MSYPQRRLRISPDDRTSSFKLKKDDHPTKTNRKHNQARRRRPWSLKQKIFLAKKFWMLLAFNTWCFTELIPNLRTSTWDVPPLHVHTTLPRTTYDAHLRHNHKKRDVLQLTVNADLSSVEKLSIMPNVVYPIHRGIPYRFRESREIIYPEPFEEGDCVAQYEWQKSSFPTCNTLHEYSFASLYSRQSETSIEHLANGWFRDAWRVKQNAAINKESTVFKTSLYQRDWYEFLYDRNRRDAVAMERMTASPNMIDIYGFCGNSVINEYANGGDLSQVFEKDKSATTNSTKGMVLAYQIARVIDDLHNMEKDGQAAIAHVDVHDFQFVFVNGRLKLHDFNDCRFIRWNRKENKACPFGVDEYVAPHRSPEYLAREPVTEKTDVYAIGNVFYEILTGKLPFNMEDDYKTAIIGGARPPIPSRLRNSKEPGHVAVIKAMEMSTMRDPNTRATAREITTFLKGELRKAGVTPQ